MLADVAEMPRPALLPIHWEPQEDPRLPALLSGGAPVSEGTSEPLQLSLILAFTSLAVTPRPMAREEESLAPAAHEGAMFEGMAPLMYSRLLGGMAFPLPASARKLVNST